MPRTTTNREPTQRELYQSEQGLGSFGELEPLMAKIAAIGRDLDDLRRLTQAKKSEIQKLCEDSTLLSRKDAAALLEISASQLDRQARKGAIEEVLIDRRPRYCLCDLKAFISARRTTRRERSSPSSRLLTDKVLSSTVGKSGAIPSGRGKRSKGDRSI